MNMSTQRWVRFLHDGAVGFGTLAGDAIQAFDGDMFANPRPTGKTVALASVKLLRPAEPGKVIALYNNFRPWLEKLNVSRPLEPLYFLKPPSAYLDPGEVIRRPASDSRVVFEGELAIVIGRSCKNVAPAAGAGATCLATPAPTT